MTDDFSKVHRCSICNCVSVSDIQTNIGDFKDHMSFTPDPKDKTQFICIECAEAINDVLYDYQLDDEWKEFENEILSETQ